MGFFDRYPYTNWHNVNLDWILERVKEWGQMVVANDQAFQDLEAANASFKEYVTNYLQDLDVQAAIDDKLDRMFESGVLGEYLQPYVSPAVTTWLEENITEPEGVVIDSSLTVAGAAADAKATGDAINELSNRLDNSDLSTEIKDALLTCFRNVAWKNRDGDNYFIGLQSALYPDTPQHVIGWLYRFNDNLISSGTKDFSLIGIPDFVSGVNGKAYFHRVLTEGDASTDQKGLYALNIEDLPDFSEDFTISFWCKTVTQKRGYLVRFTDFKSSNRVPVYMVTVDNPYWTETVVQSSTVSESSTGLRFSFHPTNGNLIIGMNLLTDNKTIYTNLTMPSDINTTVWHHYALTRGNGVIRFFFDGELIFHINNSDPLYLANQLSIGNQFGTTNETQHLLNNSEYGNMFDDLFIVPYAKWTSNFNPLNIVY